MGAYIIRRLLLMIPTVFGIMAVSFLITQFAPGGPVEQALADLSGQNTGALERVTGSEGGDFAGQQAQGGNSTYRGSQGLPPATGQLDQTIGQGRFAVVDMRNDRKVTNVFLPV